MLRRSAAVGAVVGTAGCSSLFGATGGNTDIFTQWLPAPAAIDTTDHYWFNYYDLETLAAQRENLGGEPTVFERTWQPVGLDWDDATAVVTVAGVDVVTADVTTSDAVSDLEDAGYDSAGEYKGYAVYRNRDTGTVFAVTDGTLLVSAVDQYATGSADPSGHIEAVVEARTGDVDRYAETSEDMSELVSELGAATLVTGTTMDPPDGVEAKSGRFDNLVAEGRQSAVDGETVEEQWVYLYERPRDVDVAALKAYVRANDNGSSRVGARFETVTDISYSAEGRAGIITGTRDASEYYGDN